MVSVKHAVAHSFLSAKILPVLFFRLKAALLLGLIASSTLFSSSLNLTIAGFPARLNPLLATDSVSSQISSYLFDSLVKYDKDGKIVPDLASSWSFEDSKTVVFVLRDDIFWHDGKKITAEDVVFTYTTAISDKVFTPYSSNFRMVLSANALDPLTVRVRYKEPYFKALETWLMPIIPKHILENSSDLMTSEFNRKPIGSSYYTIKDLEISKNIELFANSSYRPRAPFINKIVFEYVQDPSVEFLKLKNRQIHIGSLDAMQVDRQLDKNFEKDYQIVEYPAFSYNYLGFNLTNKKFQDPKVREALSYAIDRKELVEILFFGHAKVSHGPILEGALGFNETVKSPTQDLMKARKLLKEAGYDEDNPLEFEIATNSNNQIRVFSAEIIQRQLSLVGVKVSLRVMEWQAFLSRVVQARNFETVLLAWSVPLMPDPFTIWHSDSTKRGGFNFVGYKNSTVDKIIEEAETKVDRDEVVKLFRKFHQIIVDDNPYLFLYSPNAISAISRKITPIEPTIMGFTHNRFDWKIEQ